VKRRPSTSVERSHIPQVQRGTIDIHRRQEAKHRSLAMDVDIADEDLTQNILNSVKNLTTNAKRGLSKADSDSKLLLNAYSNS